MEQSQYDRRDARQRCGWFVGFAFFASWTIWAGLWAPGVHRLAYVPTLIMSLGMWGPALAAKLTLVLFRARRPIIGDAAESEPATTLEYLLATSLSVLCCLAAVGLSFALGGSSWQWNWMPSGYPFVIGGFLSRMTIEVYDTINRIGLVAQTAIVELSLWFAILIVLAGAEIGWRGVLLPNLVRAGFRPWLASVMVGVAWGLWLAPLVWKGVLTDFYPGDPVQGTIAIVASGAAWGTLLGWLYLRNLRLGPVVAAVSWVVWTAWVLPNVSSPYNPLLYADPRSASCAAIVAAVAALLWYFAPPAATLDRPVKPLD